ncbi:MAG: hypothetical protein WCX48_02860 [Bacteroidales bacterium]
MQDLDSLNDEDVISPLKWEELNIAADNIKQKINTLMFEHERSNLAKLNQTIVELKRSFSDVRHNVTKPFDPYVNTEEKSKLTLDVEEEEMELFYDGRTSILDEATSKSVPWMSDMPGPKLEDISDAITLNDKLFFIRELFNEDEEQYRLSIQKLNDMKTLNEALEYTRTAFPDWDEESDIIYRFYMILRRKFDA